MKVFGQSRKKLVSGKGFRKYLLYAIGEIILVVIGILIAVSINNANETQKAAKKRTELATLVLQQMATDSLNLDVVITSQNNSKAGFYKVLRATAPEDPIVDCVRCPFMILTNFNVANMDPKVRTLLERSVLLEDSISMRLLKIESDYKHYDNIFRLLEESIVDNLKVNIGYLRDTYPWFSQFISQQKCNEECQAYFQRSPDFRNRVAYMELLVFNAYGQELLAFKRRLREHMIALEKAIE